MAPTNETGRAVGAARLVGLSCLSGDDPRIAQNPLAAQAQKRTAVVLRLLPLPGRLEVRITAARGREPIGRTRPLMIRECDLARLVDVAEKLARP
jgi:hypothetical protein